MVSDEKFFAWLDGELGPDDAAEVADAVARDPELARRAQEHRAMQAGLRQAFGRLPEPRADLSAVIRADAGERIVSLDAARAERRARPVPPLWKQVAAMAATLALGVFAGTLLSGDASSPIQPEAGRLVAAASLEEALYTRLASAPAGEGPRIGLTYRDRSGDICRTFTDRGASGLACREGGDWQIRGLFQAPEGQGTEYRMAAGPDPRLMELVDSTMAGEPFDAAAEAQAKQRGWR